MNRIYLFFLTFIILFSTACERNDLWSKFNGSETDPPSPITAVVTPAGGAWIARGGSINNTITVLFDSSMDTASLSIAGTMGASTQAWSTTTLTDDTLTIIPSSLGEGTTLSITCDSLEGASITLNRTYNTAESVYYVKASATGALTGTRTDPMDWIQTAIEDAVLAVTTPCVVLVAEGTFSTSTTMITLDADISIYGGYSGSDWDVRDPSIYITSLVDTRTNAGITNPSNPARIIEVMSGATSTTVIDGLTLSIAGFTDSSTASAAAIFIDDASPVISNNNIDSPDISGGTTCTTIGISHISGGSPTITNNSISLGTRTVTADGCNNYGIYSTAGTPTIQENTIDAGEVTGTASISTVIGVYTLYGTPTLTDNIITAGNGLAQSTGLQLIECSGTFLNNTITAGGASVSYGIYSVASNADVFSPNISYNTINGGTGNDAMGIQFTSYTLGNITGNRITAKSSTNSRGIDLKSQSAPEINSNIIYGLTGSDTLAIRIQIERSDTQILVYNNVLDGSGGTAISMGMEIADESNVALVNNIIKGGAGGTANYALYLDNPSFSANYFIKMANNHIYTDAGGYGIYENIYESRPTTVTNNNFFISGTFYREYTGNLINNPMDIDNIDTTGTGFDGNISNDIYSDIITTSEYRYTGTYTNAGIDFDSKGMDGSGWGFTTDRDGNPRTADWSIGPYEYD